MANVTFWFWRLRSRKLDYPVAPAVLSIVLGPLAENALRQSLILSDGSMGIFFDFASKPIAAIIMYIAIVLLIMPAFGPLYRKIFKKTPSKA